MSEVTDARCIIGKSAQLKFPSGILFDESYNILYISSMQESKVVKYSFHTNELKKLPNTCSRERGKLKKPLAICMNENKHLLVTDARHDCIFSYVDNIWEEVRFSGDIKMNLPGSITCDKEDNIFVTDFLNNRICKIDRYNRISIIKEIICQKPYGIYLSNHILYITDTAHNKIQWFNIITKEQGYIPESGLKPIAITADVDGDIYFSEMKRLFLYHQQSKKVELILDNKKWNRYHLARLCHIGAMVSVSKNRFIFSDTIQNCIYEIMIKKSEEIRSA